MLTLVKSSEIDKNWWNEKVLKFNPYSFFAFYEILDILSDGKWELLSYNNNIFIPIVYKKYLGLKIAYNPIFCGRLGVIFNGKEFDYNVVKEFIVKNYFLRGFLSEFSLDNEKLQNKERFYQYLYVNKLKYSKSHRRNIKEAYAQNIKFKFHNDINFFVEKLRRFYTIKKIYLKDKDFMHLVLLLEFIQKNGNLMIIEGRFNDEIGSLIAFLEFNGRATLYSLTTQLGRSFGSFFAVVDKYIQLNHGKNLLIDFGGSSIEGIRQRNLGFGAEEIVCFEVNDILFTKFRKIFG